FRGLSNKPRSRIFRSTARAFVVTGAVSTLPGSMLELTKRQQEVFSFIELTRARDGHSPTLREIATHFGFRSPKAAADHVTALQRKGILSGAARKARALRVISPWEKMLQPVIHVPIYGTIPAGLADER